MAVECVFVLFNVMTLHVFVLSSDLVNFSCVLLDLFFLSTLSDSGSVVPDLGICSLCVVGFGHLFTVCCVT